MKTQKKILSLVFAAALAGACRPSGAEEKAMVRRDEEAFREDRFRVLPKSATMMGERVVCYLLEAVPDNGKRYSACIEHGAARRVMSFRIVSR